MNYIKKNYFIYLALWFAISLISYLAIFYYLMRGTEKELFSLSKALFDKDIIYRKWNSQHNGVYVKVTETNPPNPYLEHKYRDITTDSGLKLTMINPAYMTRQAHSIQNTDLEIKSRIISNNPINPINKSDDWEAEMLNKMKTENDNFSEFITFSDAYSYRFISPLIITQSCLNCHEKDGYKLGDIKGGISVSIPASKYIANRNQKIFLFTLFYAVIFTGGFIIIFWSYKKNITASTEIERKKIEAEAAAVAKSNFLANMSHEIRTPMNAIIGFCELLYELPDNTPTHKQYLQIINNSGKHFLNVINDILDFSKIEADKIEILNDSFCLKQFFDNIYKMFQIKAGEKSIAFIRNTKDIGCIIVQGDAFRLNQILINILSNAFKFTMEGNVILSASYMNAILEIEIIDTGVGIPDEKIESIFMPFEQADISSSRVFGGTGLGLSISKRLIELMGGIIKIKSEKGKGTKFIISVPLHQIKKENFNCESCNLKEINKSSETENNNDNIQKVIKNKYEDLIENFQKNKENFKTESIEILKNKSEFKILLIEDNDINRHFFLLVALKNNYKMDFAENGQLGLDKIKTQKYDLLFIDIQMPVMTGEELIKILKADDKFSSIPAIALTAHSLTSDKDKFLKLGFDGYLTKPLNRDEYIKLIDFYFQKFQSAGNPKKK